MRQSWLFLLCFLYAGCVMQNLSPTEKLRDTVMELNEQTRWQRIDVAAQLVHPDYQTAFRVSRAHWVQRVEISEVEVLAIKRGIDKDGSSQAIVLFNWYDKSTMTAHSSTVEQIYAKVRRDFLLRRENIVAGDPGLLNLSVSSQLSGSTVVETEASAP